MNQSQKKYTINSIISLLGAQAETIEKDECALYNEIVESNSFNLDTFIANVNAGKVKLVKGAAFKKAIDKFASRHYCELEDMLKIFNLPDYTKARKKALIKKGFGEQCRITLGNPLQNTTETYYAKTPKSIARLNKIKTEFDKCVSQIMLGNSKDALELIEKVSKMKF